MHLITGILQFHSFSKVNRGQVTALKPAFIYPNLKSQCLEYSPGHLLVGTQLPCGCPEGCAWMNGTEIIESTSCTGSKLRPILDLSP